jgi:hypothetical protein
VLWIHIWESLTQTVHNQIIHAYFLALKIKNFHNLPTFMRYRKPPFCRAPAAHGKGFAVCFPQVHTTKATQQRLARQSDFVVYLLPCVISAHGKKNTKTKKANKPHRGCPAGHHTPQPAPHRALGAFHKPPHHCCRHQAWRSHVGACAERAERRPLPTPHHCCHHGHCNHYITTANCEKGAKRDASERDREIT